MLMAKGYKTLHSPNRTKLPYLHALGSNACPAVMVPHKVEHFHLGVKDIILYAHEWLKGAKHCISQTEPNYHIYMLKLKPALLLWHKVEPFHLGVKDIILYAHG